MYEYVVFFDYVLLQLQFCCAMMNILYVLIFSYYLGTYSVYTNHYVLLSYRRNR